MNTADLCRLISISFTGGELRALASELGVSSEIDWERGTASAARDLVRYFERGGTMPVLVAKLSEARPLVEWPEAMPSVAAAPPPAPPPPLVEALSAPAPAPTTLPQKASEAPLPTKPDPYLTPKWPGTTDPRAGEKNKQNTKNIDPKNPIIIGAVASIVVVAALIAYFVGRSASSPERGDATNTKSTIELAASASASARAQAAASAKARIPSWIVSAAIAKGLANVARNCELPINENAQNIDESVISRALALCGRPNSQEQIPYNPSENTNNTNESQETREKPSAKTTKTGEKAIESPKALPRPKSNEAPPPAAGGSGGGCLNGCNTEHNTCKKQCGKEPTESSLYEQFQSCNSRCLVAFSKCKRSCQ